MHTSSNNIRYQYSLERNQLWGRGMIYHNKLHSANIGAGIFRCLIYWQHFPTVGNYQDSPQIISRVHSVMYKKQSNVSPSTCVLSFWTRMLACSFITSRKSDKMVKWKVGVNIFLLVRHLFPSLQHRVILQNHSLLHITPFLQPNPKQYALILMVYFTALRWFSKWSFSWVVTGKHDFLY